MTHVESMRLQAALRSLGGANPRCCFLLLLPLTAFRVAEEAQAAAAADEAMNQTALDDVKAVIVGQDPYHGLGQAHGLAFSLKPDAPGRFPPTSRIIMRELERDYIPRPRRRSRGPGASRPPTISWRRSAAGPSTGTSRWAATRPSCSLRTTLYNGGRSSAWSPRSPFYATADLANVMHAVPSPRDSVSRS